MALPNEPITRQEMYLSNIAGQNTALPDAPITREEMYLDYIAKTGGTGEGDMKKSVYDSDNSVASAGGIKMFVNQKIGTIPQKVGTLETKVSVLEGEVASIEDNLDNLGTASTKNSTSVVTESTDLVESGAVCRAIGIDFKNLLDITVQSGSHRQVNFTINSDKTITANGTATGGNSSYTINEKVDIKAGTYIGSGGISVDKLFVLTAWNGSTYVRNIAQIGATPVEFTVDFDGYDTVQASVFVRSGITANNDKFYLMVRNANITDATYEPYHASVNQTLRNAEVIDGKNLLKNVKDTITLSSASVISNVTDSGFTLTATNVAYGSTKTDLSYLQVGRKYIVSIKVVSSTGSEGRLTIRDDNYIIKKFIKFGTTAGKYTLEFTYQSGYYISILATMDTVSSAVVTVDEMMICEVNEDANTYEPHYTPLKDVVPQKCDNSVIGTVEDGTNPTKSYAVGEHMIRGGKFCTVTVAVTTSSTWTLGGNYVEGDVASILKTESIIDMNNHNVSLAKSGNVATLSFEVSTEYDVAANAVIYTLPQGYKPLVKLSFNDTYGNKRLIVYTNGQVQTLEALSNTYLRGAVTYVTSND